VAALAVLGLSFAASSLSQATPGSVSNAACPNPFTKEEVVTTGDPNDLNGDGYICSMTLPGFANATEVTVDNNVHVRTAP
jgi:hypothetical protein